MLKESLKWMFLTLAVAALLIGGVVGLVSAISAPAAAFEPSSTPTLSPSPAPTPSASPTPVTNTPQPSETPEPTTPADPISAYIANMTVEEKLGQLVVFGFSGTTRPDNEFCKMLAETPIGNFALYGTNIDRDASDGGFRSAKKLVSALYDAVSTEIEPLVSIDVEGGDVIRFDWEETMYSPRTLGKRNDTELAYNQFETVGAKLAQTGIRMDLAPVLDVSEDPMDTFLKTRIISSDEEIVSSIGAAIIDGLHAGGCLATAKHFPGHGGTTADSHAGTPTVNFSRAALKEYDLVPFQAAIDAGVDVMLVAHIRYPALDEDNVATLSPAIMTTLLREEMGFDGIIMSDDFRMSGLTKQASPAEAAVRFLLAGGDLILCGPNHEEQRKIWNALVDAAKDGTLTAERIDQSVYRILEKKLLVTDWLP